MKAKSIGLLLLLGSLTLLGACSSTSQQGKQETPAPAPEASAPMTESSPEMSSQAENETGEGSMTEDKELEVSQVPLAVQSGFSSKFPGVTPSGWEQKPYGYEAAFTQNGMAYEADFSADGQWLKTEQEGEIPSAVQARIDQDYPGSTITKRQVEETPQGTFYEVQMQHQGKQMNLYFDSQGNPAENVPQG